MTDVIAAPGGKAAHVAMTLRTLGADPTWLGFVGGAIGAALVEGLSKLSIAVDPVFIKGTTRVNVELIERDGRVTEILEPGPCVTPAELQQLHEQMQSLLNARVPNGPVIVLFSGSLPTGVPDDCYASLIALTHDCGAHAFIDTSGEALRSALMARPAFVKPNQQEAEQLIGGSIQGPESAATALKEMLRTGAISGAISLGAQGLVWSSKEEEKALWARPPEQESRFSVGSGDATLAGFAFGVERGLDTKESLQLAAACGAANCLADAPGRAQREDIERLTEQVHVQVLQ